MPNPVEQVLPVLELDEFTANPQLAKLIPGSVALRYHSLPIAECEGWITVAMADPGDQTAQDTIRKAIGKPVKVVRGDHMAIDSVIAELWPDCSNASFQLVILMDRYGNAPLVRFGRELGEHLKADKVHVDLAPKTRKDRNAMLARSSEYELILISTTPRSRWQRTEYPGWISRLTTSCMLARQVRWPIQSMRCILRGEPSDLATVRWAARMGTMRDCAVEIVIVAPPAPLMYTGLKRLMVSTGELLRSSSKLGANVRRALRYLENWQLNASLRVIPGYSPQQVAVELYQDRPDLVIAAPQISRAPLGNEWDELVLFLAAKCETALLVTR